MIAEIALFAICCASIILCVLNGSSVPADKKVEHTMSFVFLFLHMVIIGILFLYSIRAYIAGSSFIQIITTDDHGKKNKKTMIISSILAGIFALIGVYFITVLCGVDSFGKVFSMGLQYALVNAGLTVTTLCLFLIFYKPDEIEK